MRHLYSLLLYCLLPVFLLRMLWRSRKAAAYRQRLSERFGCVPDDPAGEGRAVIWVHAVSVGETIAAVPVIETLLARYPEHRVVVTTTTPTGSERVSAVFGNRVFHVYGPWDLPGAVHRFLRQLQPQLLLIMETELWPNMLHYARASGCEVLLANARMSERSAKGYSRLSSLTRELMNNLSAVACQSQADGDRLLDLGLAAEKLAITGSIKFDLELDTSLQAQAARLREEWLGGLPRPVLLGASTHAGEEEQVLAAFTKLREIVSDCLLILVPRHPERFDPVQALCEREGWQVLRRSAGRAPGFADDIILGDTMGELLLLLSLGDVAVIGGSLVNVGGHNMLEASAWGVPVVTGPYLHNFTEISELLTSAGAMKLLQNPAGLADCLVELFTDPGKRQAMGEAGQRVVAENRGAREKLLAMVDAQL